MRKSIRDACAMLEDSPGPEKGIGIPPGKDIPQPEPTTPTELVNAAKDVMFVIKSWQENRTITILPSEERIFQRFFNALDKVKS